MTEAKRTCFILAVGVVLFVTVGVRACSTEGYEQVWLCALTAIHICGAGRSAGRRKAACELGPTRRVRCCSMLILRSYPKMRRYTMLLAWPLAFFQHSFAQKVFSFCRCFACYLKPPSVCFCIGLRSPQRMETNALFAVRRYSARIFACQ